MESALLEGLGGPLGRHARRRGIWFNPLAWTILVATGTYLLLVVRQLPCLQTSAINPINAYIRLCYSDIPLTWSSGGLGLGALPFGGDQMSYPPVLGMVLLLAAFLARLFGAPVAETLDLQGQLDGAQLYFGVVVVLLFVGFLGFVLCMSFLGEYSQQGRRRTWHGMAAAASPVVLAAGLVSYDLLGVGLAALGLLLVVRGQLMEGAIVLGLAFGAGLMAMPFILAVLVHLTLRNRWRDAGRYTAGVVGTIVVIHLPLAIQRWQAVADYYGSVLNGEAGYGSLYFLPQFFGFHWRAAGSFGLMLTGFALIAVICWAYNTQRDPQLGGWLVVFVFVTVALGAEYTPQTALWLLLAILVARPPRSWLVAFTVVEVCYWAAVWGYLAGHLNYTHSGNPGLYVLATLVHIGFAVAIAVRALRGSRPQRNQL